MGGCPGAPRPLPELPPFELLLELVLDAELDCAEATPVVLAWPWKERAAATEITPVSATAPAISHRLTREIRASPASRAPVALGFTYPMIGPT